MNTAVKAARKAIESLSEHNARRQAEAEELRMVAHIEQRTALQRELKADELEKERSEREHAENRAALTALGEKYTHAERDTISSVRDECIRLSQLVNNYKPHRSSGAAERLLDGCLNPDLQAKKQAVTDRLQDAKKRLAAAKQHEHETWAKMAQAQRDLVESFGNVSSQYGRPGKGGRWEKVEDENGVWVKSLKTETGTDAIHFENVKFLNDNLRRANRIIREGKATDFGVERISTEIEELTNDLDAVHREMIESQI